MLECGAPPPFALENMHLIGPSLAIEQSLRRPQTGHGVLAEQRENVNEPLATGGDPRWCSGAMADVERNQSRPRADLYRGIAPVAKSPMIISESARPMYSRIPIMLFRLTIIQCCRVTAVCRRSA